MRRTVFIVVSLLGFFLLLTPHAVAQDKVVVVPLFGDEATGNATVHDVLKGKTFSNSSATGLTGTRPSVPVERSGQTTSYAAGDDGALEKGVAWPNPRFTDNGDGTVTDNLTELIWLKDTFCVDTVDSVAGGVNSWNDALTYCNNLADCACGLTDGSVAGDWRLPNVRELHSLIDYGKYEPALPSGHPFDNVQNARYWSSSSRADTGIDRWMVWMDDGGVCCEFYTDRYYLWPVRGGQ